VSHGKAIRAPKAKGQLDYKIVWYGGAQDGPLNLRIEARSAGYLFVCAPPGNWGEQPKDFANFWKVDTRFFLTRNVDSALGHFNFDLEARLGGAETVGMTYTHYFGKDTQSVCVQTNDLVPKGTHVLSIAPDRASKNRIMISLIIVP
jgi:hypothetical protein